jgi:phosphatidylglycerol---prolipoprotein diacylglyceryl transferase
MNINFIHWNIDPELFNLFGFSLRYYGVLFAGGIFLSAAILRWIFRKEGIELDKLDTLTIYGLVGIFVGARLGHCLFYDPDYYFNHPLEMLLPIQFAEDGSYQFTGYLGLASHGGVAGLILALILYSRATKEPILNTLDLIAIVAPIGGICIRLGNLMNSEIIGYPTNVPWAFVFEREDQLPRHPAQLYEAICYLLIFILLIYLYKTRRSHLRHGFFFGLTTSLIFTARFFIEFLKERQVAFEEQLVLDMGQILSIPFIVVGIAFVIYGLRKTKTMVGVLSVIFILISISSNGQGRNPVHTGIGIVAIADTYNQSKSVTVFKDKRLAVKLEDFKLYGGSRMIQPFYFKPDYGLCYFVCLEKTKDYYRILINDQQQAFLKANSDLYFKTWEALLINTTIERFNISTNPIRSKPADTSEVILVTNQLPVDRLLILEVLETGGESWARIKFSRSDKLPHEAPHTDCGEGWIKWKKEDKLLIDLLLLD